MNGLPDRSRVFHRSGAMTARCSCETDMDTMGYDGLYSASRMQMVSSAVSQMYLLENFAYRALQVYKV